NRRLEQLMSEMSVKAGLTEELKAQNPLKWVGLMNSLRQQAEEIVLAEIVLI
ncbi:MAG: TnpV protein, partial [Firmicutes bacterium]|nr:TnpV protein [Bacillota bacterium]